MGKSRNSKYYRDFSDYERDKAIKKRDNRSSRRAKQARREKQYEVANDDGVNYEDDYYSVKFDRKW